MKREVLLDFVVGVYLTVEGKGPCKEVDPADHVDDCLLSLVYLAQHQISNDRFIINFSALVKSFF